MASTAQILLPIIEQHAEEAAFLWHLRDLAVEQPHYAQRHLLRLEERLEAHLDGLRVAGEVGLDLLGTQLESDLSAAAMFPVALLTLERGEASPIEPLLRIMELAPDTRHGFSGALGWAEPALIGRLVGRWLASEEPMFRLQAVIACSLHRADPGQRLAVLIADPDLSVRRRAVRLAGELGRADLLEPLRALLDDPASDPALMDWAAWSMGLLGDRERAPWLMGEWARRSAALDGGPALELAARLGEPAAIAGWVRRLNGDPATARLVLRALGAMGDPAAVGWLIGRMAEPASACLAGEAFALITGADLALLDLEGPMPENASPAGPNDDPADERVALDPDEHLPWPDPALVTAWWAERAGTMPKGRRHLLGMPIDEPCVRQAWAGGFQRQRRAAAYELALMAPAAGLPNWRMRASPAKAPR